MAQLMRRITTALIAAILALLALAAPAADHRKLAFDGDAVTIQYGSDEFVPIPPIEFLPYAQKQGPPYDLIAQVTINPAVTGNCPPGTQTVTGVTGWIGRCEERSFSVALQNSLIPEEGRGDRTPTYTRATTAYQTDFEGKQNLVLSGEARFQGARRVANLVTSSATIAVNGNQTVTVGVGTFVFSMGAEATGTALITFTGTATGSSGTLTANATSRTAKTLTITGGGTIIATCTVTACNNVQLENVTGQANQNPSEYVSVGVLSAPYHGAGVDGIQYFNTLNGNTVASNVVTEATGAPIVAGQAGVAATAPVDAKGPYGYLSEGARADVLGTTNAIRRDMSDVGWVATNVTKGTTTGIDGTASAAATLTATAGNGTVLYTTVLGAAVRTYSAWVSRITGTGTVNMTKDGGATWTPITLTSTPTLFQVTTASAANPVVGFQIVTSGDAIEVDFNTLEAATFANPTPIPVNVSKAQDVLTYSQPANVSLTSGSAYSEIYVNYSGTNAVALGLVNSYPLGYVSNVLKISDGANNPGTANAFNVGAVNKAASSWGGTVLSVVLNAGTVATGTFAGAMPDTTNKIEIGAFGGSFPLFGTIRNVRIYPTALSAARAKAITSDAADWLGSPFWRMAANDDAYRIAVNQ